MNLYSAVPSRLLVPSLVMGLVVPPALAAQRAPNVNVWFERGNEFDRGEPGQVMYTGDAGSYVTVLRVDTDGRLRILYPTRPNARSRYVAGRDGASIPFQADPTEGVGYVFAVASRTPFDFRAYRGRGDRWNTGSVDQRRAMDPFEIVDHFARNTVGSGGAYSIAYAPYEIGRAGAGRESYGRGLRYDDGYGGYGGYGSYAGGYSDPWGASPYRRGYNDFSYRPDGYGRGYRNNYEYDTRSSSDPRTRALRHCPDGTLAPYTVPCAAFPQTRDAGQQQTLQPGPMQRPVAQPRPPERP